MRKNSNRGEECKMSLAENQIISNQLEKVLVGKTITDVIVNQNPHKFVWFALEPSNAYCDSETSNEIARQYKDLLIGKTIDKSTVNFGAYGFYNFLYIGDRALMFNIPLRYIKTNEKIPKRHQLLLTLDDGSSLAFFGSLGGPIFFFKTDVDGLAIDYKPWGFPSVLTDDFSFDFFMDIINHTELRSLSVKAFLATKNRIPGLDNSILHEILWEAEINPKSKMVSLSESDFISMYNAIKKVFPQVIKNGGLDTQKDLFGNIGGYITKVSRNTLGNPCSRCGGIIAKEAFLGGAVYYCPKCQPLKMPENQKNKH